MIVAQLVKKLSRPAFSVELVSSLQKCFLKFVYNFRKTTTSLAVAWTFTFEDAQRWLTTSKECWCVSTADETWVCRHFYEVWVSADFFFFLSVDFNVELGPCSRKCFTELVCNSGLMIALGKATDVEDEVRWRSCSESVSRETSTAEEKKTDCRLSAGFQLEGTSSSEVSRLAFGVKLVCLVQKIFPTICS